MSEVKPSRRFPQLSETFEREMTAATEIADRIGKEFIMLSDGTIVRRELLQPIPPFSGEMAPKLVY